MISIERYLQKIRPFYDSDLIKIITGIRRCGKSVIFSQIIDEIMQKTDNVIFINFEEKRVTSAIHSVEALLDYVDTHRKAWLTKRRISVSLKHLAKSIKRIKKY